MKNTNILIVTALMLTTVTAVAASWELFKLNGAPNGIASPAFFEGNQITAVCCSSDGKTIYLGQNQALWKSTDGGETWKVLRP